MLVVAVAASGAAWFVHATFFDARPREWIVVLDMGADHGIQKRGDNRRQVRGGNAWLGVDKGPAGKLSLEFRFWRYDFLPADAMDTLVKVQRLVRDGAMARQVALSPERLAQLRDVRDQGKVRLPPRRRRSPARPLVRVRTHHRPQGQVGGGGQTRSRP